MSLGAKVVIHEFPFHPITLETIRSVGGSIEITTDEGW
jgi:hypothetical protein